MTVTEFLKKHASGGYVSLDSLYPLAKVELLREQETEADFTNLLTQWMAKFPQGPYYTELPFAGAKLVAISPKGGKVARIKYGSEVTASRHKVTILKFTNQHDYDKAIKWLNTFIEDVEEYSCQKDVHTITIRNMNHVNFITDQLEGANIPFTVDESTTIDDQVVAGAIILGQQTQRMIRHQATQKQQAEIHHRYGKLPKPKPAEPKPEATPEAPKAIPEKPKKSSSVPHRAAKISDEPGHPKTPDKAKPEKPGSKPKDEKPGSAKSGPTKKEPPAKPGKQEKVSKTKELKKLSSKMLKEATKGETIQVVQGAVYLTAKKGQWIQKMTDAPKFKEGALRSYFGLKEGEVLTIPMIQKELNRLQSKYPDGGYSDEDLKLVRRLNAAKNMIRSSQRKK